jgi:hypothetical protein
MDILAHSLWTNLAKEGFNLKFKKEVKTFWAIFWGIFPDLFAFTPLFVWEFFNLILGRQIITPSPEKLEPVSFNSLLISILTSSLYSLLYSISHSFIIFALVFGLIYLFKKRIYFVLFGWPLHILIDIPTHSYKFQTPFLWPISNFKFGGIIYWAEPWFMILNYSSLLIIYAFIYFYKKRKYDKNFPPEAPTCRRAGLPSSGGDPPSEEKFIPPFC